MSDTSLLQQAKAPLCLTCSILTTTRDPHVHAFHFNSSPVILLYSALLYFVSDHWRSPRPGVIIQWLTDWQALLSRPSRLQVTPNSWPVMDGSWQRPDSDWREKPCWLECYNTTAPTAKHFGGHCRSLDLCKWESAGEVLSDKAANGWGRCLEVINRRGVWVEGQQLLSEKMLMRKGNELHFPLHQQPLSKSLALVEGLAPNKWVVWMCCFSGTHWPSLVE